MGTPPKRPAAARPPAQARSTVPKQGLKRSILTEAGDIPPGAVPAPANRRDDGLLAATLDTGIPAPIQVGGRWVIERTHAWGNQYGRLRWCTERRRLVVEFWLALASAVIVCGRLLRRAWICYRWPGRPRRRP